MFFGVVASNGKVAPPMFAKAGVKIDATFYQELLRQELKPWVDANFPPGSFIFQQDGTPAHTATTMQKLIKEELGWRFWLKEMWPPSSPDLNPLDYGVWDRVAIIACETPAPNIATLRDRVAQAWVALDKREVRHICRGPRAHFLSCSDSSGTPVRGSQDNDGFLNAKEGNGGEEEAPAFSEWRRTEIEGWSLSTRQCQLLNTRRRRDDYVHLSPQVAGVAAPGGGGLLPGEAGGQGLGRIRRRRTWVEQKLALLYLFARRDF